IRFLPGTKKEDILRDIRRIIQRQTKKYKIQISGAQQPYEIDRKHFLVESLRKINRKIIGLDAFAASEGATVITFFRDLHIPAVAYGCGSYNCAHASDEYIKVGALYKGALALEEFLKSMNRRPD
ncbi:MAG: M20/M25/M40 family metallo-hydrolase, partial [Candidatus Omnitrophica bacterium]|nr:M20/M25/M40 family metallo-hydrolase [Candidatus Omnitrophota bacterium]